MVKNEHKCAETEWQEAAIYEWATLESYGELLTAAAATVQTHKHLVVLIHQRGNVIFSSSTHVRKVNSTRMKGATDITLWKFHSVLFKHNYSTVNDIRN